MELQDFLSKLSLPQDFTRRGFLKATSVMAAIGMMNQARAASGVRPYIVLETAKGILICDLDPDTARTRINEMRKAFSR